jgi:hypothetical protein
MIAYQHLQSCRQARNWLIVLLWRFRCVSRYSLMSGGKR